MKDQKEFTKFLPVFDTIYQKLLLDSNFYIQPSKDFNELIETNLMFFLKEDFSETLIKLSDEQISKEELQKIFDFVNLMIAMQIVVDEVQKIVTFNDNVKYMFGENVFKLIQEIGYVNDEANREIKTNNPTRDENIQTVLHILSRTGKRLRD